MKTSRLVLLFALILLVLNGTGDAAATPSDGSEKTYLPLVLNGWKPVTQTRFFNGSGDLVLSLEIDGVQRISPADPLSSGEAFTIPLSAGEHAYTLDLGRQNNSETIVHYRWGETFTQPPGQTLVIEINRPSLIKVLSGFTDQSYWVERTNKTGAPLGLCFDQAGRYQIFMTTGCVARGVLKEGSPVGMNRTFTLSDENGILRFNGIFYLESNPFFDITEPGEFMPVGEYRSTTITLCPLAPDCAVSSAASGSVRR